MMSSNSNLTKHKKRNSPLFSFSTNFVTLNYHELAVAVGHSIFKYNIGREEWSTIATIPDTFKWKGQYGFKNSIGHMTFDRKNNRLFISRAPFDEFQMVILNIQNGASLVWSPDSDDDLLHHHGGTGMVCIDGSIHKLLPSYDSGFGAKHVIWNEQHMKWDVLGACGEHRAWVDLCGTLIYVPSQNVILAIVVAMDENATYPANWNYNDYKRAEIWRCNIETGRWDSTSKYFKMDDSSVPVAILDSKEEYVVIQAHDRTHVLDIRDEGDYKLWSAWMNRFVNQKYVMARSHGKVHGEALVSGLIRIVEKISIPEQVSAIISAYYWGDVIHRITGTSDGKIDDEMMPLDKVLSSKNEELTKVWVEMEDSRWCEACQLWVPETHTCSNFTLCCE